MPRRPPTRASLFPEEAAPRRPTPELEEAARTAGWRLVAGVDEAGRGPLAGPVVAAAVILPPGWELPGLDDSKRLAAPLRDSLYLRITATALAWSTGLADPEEIDQNNILQASRLAMRRALAALRPSPDGALVDGLPVPDLPCPHRAVVRGDARCVVIAAASIVAKVARDRLMADLDERYPGYGFRRNQGYGTPEHLQALRELGPCPCHRRSFRPVREAAARRERGAAGGSR